MDVECPECRTVYEVDESRLPSEGATFQCQNCDHLFQLGTGASGAREDQRRWMVRQPGGGEVLYFSQFDRLHGWILDRRVDQRWELSRSGETWTALGDVPEFRPIFESVETVSNLEGDRAVEQTPGEQGSRGGERSRFDTLTQYDDETSSEEPSRKTSAPGSAVDSDSSQRESGPSTSTSTGGPIPSDDGSHGAGEPRDGGASPGSSDSSDSGAQPSTADAGDSGGGEVRLESGRFGSQTGARTSTESDNWEFEGDVEFDASAEADESIDYSAEVGGGRRWSVVIGVAVASIAAAGTLIGYLVAYQPATLERWTSALGGESADGSPASGADEEPATPREHCRRGVGGAVASAREALRDAVAERVGRAARRAGELVVEAASEGGSPESAAETGSGRGIADMVGSADAALENGRTGRARELYRRVLEVRPGNPSALSGIGWSFLNVGKPGNAVRYFRDALDRSSSHGEAYIGLGTAHRKLGQLEKALDAYRNYLQANPDGSKASIARHQRDQLERSLGIE